MAFAYLIRFPNGKAHERAIMALLKVRQPRQVFTGHRMLVTHEHIEVLNREGIPFEDITDPANDNAKKKLGKTTPLSS